MNIEDAIRIVDPNGTFSKDDPTRLRAEGFLEGFETHLRQSMRLTWQFYFIMGWLVGIGIEHLCFWLANDFKKLKEAIQKAQELKSV